MSAVEAFLRDLAAPLVVGRAWVSDPGPQSWHEVFVRPIAANLAPVVASCLFFFFLEWFCGVASGVLSSAYRKLSPAKQDDWRVCLVSIIHAVMTWPSVPGLIWPDKDILEGGHYSYSPVSQAFFALSAGYFAWDIIISFWKSWGIAFKVHAISSFGVFFFSLFPFLHYYGRYYQGVFEISTPWLHLRTVLEMAGYKNTALHTIVERTFAVSFTIVRIVGGLWVTFYWWREMVSLIVTGGAHSRIVVGFYLTANSVLMTLQVYWFYVLVRACLGLHEHTGTRKDVDTPQKKRE